MGTTDHEAGAAEGVALDIGNGVGALVVNAPPELLGREVEVAPHRSGARRVHAVVHERRAGSSTVYAAVFDSLPEGDYDLWTYPDAPPELVAVGGGRVSEVDWRTEDLGGHPSGIPTGPMPDRGQVSRLLTD